ncbi:hypothetical protein HK105_205303 [Polyrhizophydium stewartii]|uniref:DUF2461 domain-containing protein n=1 Tax=Polyrhizophydium stewartii TaxID=2732419 RepID=A0ABR4N6U8_9FUNG
MPPEHKAPRKAKAPGGDAAAADADAPKGDAKPAVLRGWAKKRHDARVASEAAKIDAASRDAGEDNDAQADADAPKGDAKPAVLRGWAKKRHDARVASDAAKADAASRAGDGDDGDDGSASGDGGKSTPAKRKAASDGDRKSKQPRADSAAARARSRRVPESDSASEDSGSGEDEFGVIERIKLPERPQPDVESPRGSIYPFTLDFLLDLAANNNSEWFRLNRPRYEAARDNFNELAAVVHERLVPLDADLADIDMRRALFRINRDVRFGNAGPYRINLSVQLQRGGKASPFAGYYVMVQPGGKSVVSAGVFYPDAHVLQRLRDGFASDAEAICRPLESAAVKERFGQKGRDLVLSFSAAHTPPLKTGPRGVAKDHPQIDLICLKCCVVGRQIPDSEVLAPDLPERLAADLAALVPFVRALNALLE